MTSSWIASSEPLDSSWPAAASVTERMVALGGEDEEKGAAIWGFSAKRGCNGYSAVPTMAYKEDLAPRRSPITPTGAGIEEALRPGLFLPLDSSAL